MTPVCLVIVAVAGAVFLCDQLVFLQLGTDVYHATETALERMEQELSQMLAQSAPAQAVLVQASYQEAFSLILKTWPLLYLVQGAWLTVLALLALAVVRHISPFRMGRACSGFAVPLWGLAVLATGAVCFFLGTAEATSNAVPETTGLCLLLSVRVLYVLQGLAVAATLLRRTSLGPVLRGVLIALLLLLELRYCVLCVFGCIDTFAHFRGRKRELEATLLEDSSSPDTEKTERG